MPGSKPGERRGGRKKGSKNKIPKLLADDILEAATDAHPQGRRAYLTQQAINNPNAFLGLLGKVLPLQVNAAISGGLTLVVSGTDADL